MSNYPEALDHMLQAWNEPEANKVSVHLERALSTNVRFVDPSADVFGLEGFAQNIHEVKSKIPRAVYSRTSGIDTQHNFHRYHWAIHQDGKLLLSGFDVTETDAFGKVLCVIGFFGEIPEQ